MASNHKLKLPNPGWLFFWIFSIILFMFLSFHHGSYNVEEPVERRFQKDQPEPQKTPSSGSFKNEAQFGGPVVANTKM